MRYLFLLTIICCSEAIAQPKISYLIPDIGTNDFATFVEIVAPYDANSNFGTDGLSANNTNDAVRVVLDRPADSVLVTIGPLVISQRGKLISTHFFVGHCPVPATTVWSLVDDRFRIPFHVVVKGVPSNSDTFFIVKPTPKLSSSSGGILGSGGNWGRRSKRGAILYSEVTLTGGTYTVSTQDCDPYTAGNQGYLPAIILCKGIFTASNGTVIDVSAVGANGGPGGGGGSMGDGPSSAKGGAGYTGGSPGESASCPGVGGDGSGASGDHFLGGNGLSGLPTTPIDTKECQYFGGSGNPFFSEGGGVLQPGLKHEGDGNGGGFATVGENGRGERGNATDLGGLINGNPMLSPLAGGSGGGGGNEFCSCANAGPGGIAGGGGGAAVLYALKLEMAQGELHSNGGQGLSGGLGCVGHSSVGGCGSGGGVVVESKTIANFPKLEVFGGNSIHSHASSGNGGAGRVRSDGRSNASLLISPVTASSYVGLSMDTLSVVGGIYRITGSGNGSGILLYYKHDADNWQVLTSTSGKTWSTQTFAASSGRTLLVAMQKVSSPSTNQATYEPAWIMSQAASNILYSGAGALGDDEPLVIVDHFAQTPSCESRTITSNLSTFCGQLTLDTVEIVEDTAGVFQLNQAVLPRELDINGLDKSEILFSPNNRAGVYGAKVHYRGTLHRTEGDVVFDTVIVLIASATSKPSTLFESTALRTLNLPACQSADTTLTFIVDGCDSLVVDSVRFYSSNSLVVIPPTVPLPLPRDGRLQVKLHINTGAKTGDSVRVIIYFSSGGSAATVARLVTLVRAPALPLFSITGADDFGIKSICAQLDTFLRVSNDGCDSLVIDSLWLSGSGIDFDKTQLPLILAPGESRILRLSWQPAAGSNSGVITLSGVNKGLTTRHTINWRGVGIRNTTIELSAESFAIEGLTACDKFDTLLHIHNPTCDTLIFTRARLSGLDGVNLDTAGLPVVIPPNGSLDLRLVLDQPALGRLSGWIYLSFLLGTNQRDVSISAIFDVKASPVRIQSIVLPIGSILFCDSVQRVLTLENLGCDSLHIDSVQVVSGEGLAVEGASLRSMVSGDSLWIRLKFTPAKKGEIQGRISVHYHTSSGIVGDTLLEINGLVLDGSKLLSAGDPIRSRVRVCDRVDSSIVLRNYGCDSVDVYNASLTHGSITGTFLPSTIAPGDSLRLRFFGQPDTTAGKRVYFDTLTIQSNAAVPLIRIPMEYQIILPEEIDYSAVLAGNIEAGDTALLVMAPAPLTSKLCDSLSFVVKLGAEAGKVVGVLTASPLMWTIAADGLYVRIFGPTPGGQMPTVTILVRGFLSRDSIVYASISEMEGYLHGSMIDSCDMVLRGPSDTWFGILTGCGDATIRHRIGGAPFVAFVNASSTLVDLVLISHESEPIAAEIQVIDLLGSVVDRKYVRVNTGKNTYPISPLMSGTYFIRTTIGKIILTSKLQVRR